MNAIQQAVDESNAGAVLLSRGNFRQASTAFHRSLRWIREASIIDGNECNARSSDHSQTRRVMFEIVPSFTENSSAVGLDCAHGHCFVYSCPLFLHVIETQREENTSDCTLLTASVVLFNRALTYHHFNLSPRQRDLSHAAKMYGMCADLLGSLSQCERAMYRDQLCIGSVAAVALNNQAQIFYLQNDYDRSQACLESVSEILRLGGETLWLDDTVVDGLVFNMLLLGRPHTADAA
jgi:tetratricopeptide (TPR) repeat protein